MSNKSRGCIPVIWRVRFKNKTMPLPHRTIFFQKCTIPRMFPGVSPGSTPGKSNDECIKCNASGKQIKARFHFANAILSSLELVSKAHKYKNVLNPITLACFRYHWKDLFLLQNLSISDALFGQLQYQK